MLLPITKLYIVENRIVLSEKQNETKQNKKICICHSIIELYIYIYIHMHTRIHRHIHEPILKSKSIYLRKMMIDK